MSLGKRFRPNAISQYTVKSLRRIILKSHQAIDVTAVLNRVA
jgi:hypothetical protein